MTNFPSPLAVPGPASMRSGGMPVQEDTSALARGVAGLASGIDRFAQGVDTVATRQMEQENAVDIARAEAFKTQKFYDIQNSFARDTDYSTFNERASPMVTDAVDKAASLIRDDRVRERWLAQAEDGKIRMLEAINDHGLAIKRDNEVAGLIGSMNENARLLSDPSVPRAVRDKARADIVGSLDMGQKAGLLDATKAEELHRTILDNADQQLAVNLAQTDLLIDPSRVATGMAIPGVSSAGGSVVNAIAAVDGGVSIDPALGAVTAKLLGDANFPTEPKEQAAYLSDPGVARDYADAAVAYLSDRYKGDLSAVAIAMDPHGGTTVADRWVASRHNENSLPGDVRSHYRAVMGAISAPVPATRIPLIADPGINLGDYDPNVLGRFEQLQSAFGSALPIISVDKSEGFDRRSVSIDVKALDDDQRTRLFQMASAMGFAGIGINGDTLSLDATGKPHVWGDTPAWAKDAIAAHLAGKVEAIPALSSGVAPEYAALTYDQRLQLYGQAKQAMAQRDIGLKASLETIVANAPAAFGATGKYDGEMPDANTFVHAYGAVEGIQRWHAFEADADTHKLVFSMRTMSNADIAAAVSAATPTSSGNDAALEAERFKVLQAAGTSILKARDDDPAGYVVGAYPAVAEAFKAAGDDPSKLSDALLMSSLAQSSLGIDKIELLPKSYADNAVSTFKDMSRPAAERAAAVVGLVQAARTPEMQKAVYRQLVDAGLPDMTRGVMVATLRGDSEAAATLLRAALIDPSKMGPKFSDEATTTAISNALHEQMFGKNQIGDVIYGTSHATPESLARLAPDLELIDRAAKLRLIDGSSANAADAVRMTIKDMYGDVKAVTGNGGGLLNIGAGANLKITLPSDQDETPIRKGFTALQPMVKNAIVSTMMASVPWATGGDEVYRSKLAAQQQADLTLADGWFENAGEGKYAFYDPYSDADVVAPDGNPLIFTADQVMKAGGDPTGGTW